MSDHQITMVVRDKIPVLSGERYIVCHNEDYELILDLDAEWDAYDTVTVLFHMPRGGGTVTVLSEGRRCAVPACTEQGIMRVGITAGNVLRTSTPAEITVLRSARNDADEEAVTMPPDITQQIIARQDELEEKLEQGGAAQDKYIASYRIISDLDTNTHTLELKYNDDNVLSIKLPKMGIDIDRVVKFGTEDPTGETLGQTKQLYVNTATGRMWVCENGNMMPMHWIGLSGAGSTGGEIEAPGLGSGGAVLYTPQGLTEEQQTQARANIGAAKQNSDDETIEMLIEADMLPAVTTPSGAILTDNSGNVILRY